MLIETLLGAGFTGTKLLGGALGSLFGDKGGEDMTRIEDKFTTQANMENQQQKSLLYSNLQNKIGTSLRTRQRDATDMATKSLGNQSNFGLSGNSMTAGALKSMAGANGMNTVMDTTDKAYDGYAQGMQQTNQFTKDLASDVNLRFNPKDPGAVNDIAGMIKNLPQTMLDSETQADLFDKTTEGKNKQAVGAKGILNLFGNILNPMGLFGGNG